MIGTGQPVSKYYRPPMEAMDGHTIFNALDGLSCMLYRRHMDIELVSTMTLPLVSGWNVPLCDHRLPPLVSRWVGRGVEGKTTQARQDKGCPAVIQGRARPAKFGLAFLGS